VLRRQCAKLCALEDSRDPAVLHSIGIVVPDAGADRERAARPGSSASSRRSRTRSAACLMQSLDRSMSQDTWCNVKFLYGDGAYTTGTGDPFPAIFLHAVRSVFTSVCLPLGKGG
jgi:hypothetical protein